MEQIKPMKDNLQQVSDATQERINYLQSLHEEMRLITNRLIDIKAEVDRIKQEMEDNS